MGMATDSNPTKKHRIHASFWAGLLLLVPTVWGICKEVLSFFKWGMDWRSRIDEVSATYRDRLDGCYLQLFLLALP
jgi:hypothetical protein